MLRSFCVKINNKSILDYLQYEFENSDLDELYISQHKFKNYKNIILHYKADDVSSRGTQKDRKTTRKPGKYRNAHGSQQYIDQHGQRSPSSTQHKHGHKHAEGLKGKGDGRRDADPGTDGDQSRENAD